MANTPRFNYLRGGNIDYGNVPDTGFSKNVPRIENGQIVFGVPKKKPQRKARRAK